MDYNDEILIMDCYIEWDWWVCVCIRLEYLELS